MKIKRPVITESTKNDFFRLVLRAMPIPFIPVPELYDLVTNFQRSQRELDQQVTEAIEALQHSSDLISQLEKGLQERTENLEQLRAEYERYSKLAKIEEEEVKALTEQLEITIGKSQGKERWVALGINLFVGLFIFVLGILSSKTVTSWAEYWFPSLR